MLFYNSKDESAWGLALVGFLVVAFAAFLGEVTGNVQPTAPVAMSHPDVSSPGTHQRLEEPAGHSWDSPYPQPAPGK